MAVSHTEGAKAKALVRLLIRRAESKADETDENGKPKKLTKDERDKLVKTIRQLMRVAFDPSVGPEERDAFMQKAMNLARDYGISLDDITAGTAREDHGDDNGGAGEIVPPSTEPMLVARYLMPDWSDDDGNPTLRYWNGMWMQHEGPRWAQQDDEQVRGWFYRRLEDAVTVKDMELVRWSPDRGKINKVLDALGAALTFIPTSTVVPSWLEDNGSKAESEIVALDNGLLDISTRKLRPLSARYFNEISVPFNYDPAADTPRRWMQFLDEVWPDDLGARDLLQEWFGYVISGRTDMHKIIGLFGPPRSGKGTAARILTELVGKENVAGPTIASLGGEYGLSPLVGKTLAIVPDARMGSKGDNPAGVERLLSISGEDRQTVNRKYRRQWTGTLSARVMVLSNLVPRFADASGAIVSRFLMLPFEVQFLGREETDLTERLIRELPGILNWSLDGLDRLRHTGKFSTSAHAGELIDNMRHQSSPVKMFVEDECKRGPGEKIKKDDLFAAFRTWCKETGNTPGTTQQFSSDLTGAYPDISTVRPRAGSDDRKRTWVGIDLKKEEE